MKTVYESTKDLSGKPFSYTYYKHGQFSMDVSDTLEDLELMEYVGRRPLPNRTGFCYTAILDNDSMAIAEMIAKVDPNARESIDAAVGEVGYLPEKELLDKMYNELKALGKEFNDSLFIANMPEEVSVKNLDVEETESLELFLNPEFNAAIGGIAEASEAPAIDLDTVKKVKKLP